jgi:general stress protein 26
MSDLKDRILDDFKGPCLSGLATITEDGRPWVRYVMVEASDDMTFRCSTFTNGRKIPQIADNPEVHLTCGIIQPTEKGPYLQIEGRAEVRTDAEAKHAFWSDRLSVVFDGPDAPNYGVVVIQAYRIESWMVGEGLIEVWERE